MNFTVSNMLKIGLSNMDWQIWIDKYGLTNLKCDNLFLVTTPLLCVVPTYGSRSSSLSNFIYISVKKGKGKIESQKSILNWAKYVFRNYSNIHFSMERVRIVVIKFRSIDRSFINGKSATSPPVFLFHFRNTSYLFRYEMKKFQSVC